MQKAATLLELLVVGLLLLGPTPDCFAKTEAARIVMVVADNDFTDEEYFETRAEFEREGEGHCLQSQGYVGGKP